MSNNIYYTKVLVDDVEHSEIDMDLQILFGFNYDKHDDFVEIPQGYGDADGYPIAIDRMIQTLESMKTKGATHVEMNYHEGHIGYEISGYIIRPSTTEEIAVMENKKLTIDQKNARIAELYAEIRRLQHE